MSRGFVGTILVHFFSPNGGRIRGRFFLDLLFIYAN